MADRLTKLRERLARDAKVGKAAKAKKDEQDGNDEPHQPLDWQDAFDTIAHAAGFSSTAGGGSADDNAPRATVAPYEVLEMLMRRAQAVVAGRSHADEVAAVRSLFTPVFLNTLVSDLYAAWEIQNSPTQVKMRAALEIVLGVAAPTLLDLPGVFLHLRDLLVVDPPDRKRHLHILDVLLKHGTVESFDVFAADPGAADDVKADVLRYFLRTITLSEELSQLAGKVVVSWIGKCWDAGFTDDQAFWTVLTLEACRQSPKELQKISTYVLPGLFARRKAAFRELLSACGCLNGEALAVPEEEDDLAIALDVVKVGNALNLVESEAGPTSASFKIPYPDALLKTCLLRSSPSLRSAALSVLVLSSSPSVQLPTASFPLLADFFKFSLGEEDAEFRMHLSHLTGRLLLRLRDSSLKAQRTADKGKDGAAAAARYVETVQHWLTWLLDLVSRVNLNPARPFRLKLNSLRILDHALQARIDLRYRVGDLDASITGYSSYRRAATTSISLFQLQHRHVEQRAQASSGESSSEASRPATPVDKSGAESGWPFTVDLVNPKVTQTLLRQLSSTYTALRFLVISTLERFPSPLPGYEGPDGVERAQQDLLKPALRMIRSGREAEASAGASVVGLVWRKWVFEDLRNATETSAPRWTLGHVGGWKEGGDTSQGPAGFAFISSLLDLADYQLEQYSADLATAAASTPMHGTLLALRHLLISIPNAAYDALSELEPRRALFHRILAVIRRVWEVTSPVLAASGPGDEADNEEARALRFSTNANGSTGPSAGEGNDEAVDGTGGPQYKIILNACWRAMKEAGELLETILRIPSEFDSAAFRFVWRYDEVCEIGDLFGTWLRLARHRGTVANLHPCYTRTAAALLVAGKEWQEVNELPRKWLDGHLEAIVTAGISTTRRSAALPFIILGLMMAILPYDRAVFGESLERLFDIAESTTGEIKDESRVHAMNTIRTIYLDSKGGVAAAQWIERGFILSLRLFWSPNWILRNVAMMLYATLVTRALHPRRVNLDRDPEALAKRVSIADFFSRFPQLHAILLAELERGLKDSLDDLPSSNLDSPLFAILMLFGLLQTRESTGTASGPQTGAALSAPFIPLVKACARSRVWKIRGAAGDALTGLTPPSQVGRTCVDLMSSIRREAASLSLNELHGRVVQVLRLLQSSEALDAATSYEVAHVYLRAAEYVFYPTPPGRLDDGRLRVEHPYATLAAFVNIAPLLGSSCRNSPLADIAVDTLKRAQSWTVDAYHLPSAEEYLRACWSVTYDSAAEGEERQAVLRAGLVDRSLEVRRECLRVIQTTLHGGDLLSVQALYETLLALVVDEQEPSDVRISAAKLLQRAGEEQAAHDERRFRSLMRVYDSTRNIPLRQSLLPLVAAGTPPSDRHHVLKLLAESSRMEQTVEEREAAASALVAFATSSPNAQLAAELKPLHARILLRLLQDDDITVREAAGLAARSKWIEGKAVEQVLKQADSGLLSLIQADEDTEFREDCELLANPSSLLFAVEKPNIFRDVLLVPSILHEFGAQYSQAAGQAGAHASEQIAALASAIKANPSLAPGPLGLAGNELASRWAATYLRDTEAGTRPKMDQGVPESLWACV